MHMRSGTVAIVALACIGGGVTPALAQSDDDPFNGAYVGFSLGLADANIHGGNDTFGETDFTYGGFMGFRHHQVNGLVYGAELHLDSSKINGTSNIVYATPPGEPALTTAKLGRAWGGDALIGMTLFQDDALVFATVGYTNQKLSGLRTSTVNVSPPATEPYSFTEDGYRLGLGLEFSVLPNLNWRIMGRYTDSGRVNQKVVTTGAVFNF